jgi:transposase InsO family protein
MSIRHRHALLGAREHRDHPYLAAGRLAELKRRGWAVNHERDYRLVRKDNLLCLRRRKFVVTTDSGNAVTVYPNLTRTMVLAGLDQLWVADITYIRLELEFVYLAVILDAFSRRVVGWARNRTLEAEGARVSRLATVPPRMAFHNTLLLAPGAVRVPAPSP